MPVLHPGRLALLPYLLVCLLACSPPAEKAVVEDSGSATPAQAVALHKAAVAMPDTYGAKVAEEVLRAGGNAVDAAIAAGFALAVTYPEAGNIGGGGFMLIHFDGKASFVDYRETAPAAAHRDMYLDENGEVIEGASLFGHLSVGVPGTVAGMWEAHKQFATRPWEELLQPAVKLASEGFIVPDSLGSGMKSMQSEYAGKTNFDRYFAHMQAGTLF